MKEQRHVDDEYVIKNVEPWKKSHLGFRKYGFISSK
jgi:hypothetical protein